MSELSISWPRFEPRTTRRYIRNFETVSAFRLLGRIGQGEEENEEGKEEHEVIKMEDSKEEEEEEI